jgi:signal transduction protein with GAF and PtsI domain
MSPPAIGPIKDMIRAINLNELKALLNAVLAGNGASPRAALDEFARGRGISV